MRLGYAWVMLLVLVQVVDVAKGEWSPPVKLTNGTRDSTFPEMYIDPVTKITHTLWIDNQGSDYRLAYAQIGPDKKMSTPILLETAHRARLSHIIGGQDSQHLLIGFDAKRSQGDRNDCNADDTSGCFEIFFTESKDGGKIWSKPVMIPHDEPNDQRDRKGPRLIYVKETKQVFMTYQRNGPMAYTIRREDGAFSKEAAFPFSMTTAYQSIVYTLTDTQVPMLHFFYVNWTYPEEHLMYTSSLDGGLTWRSPQELIAYMHQSSADSYFRPYAVARQDILAKTILIVFIWQNQVHTMWSLNNGRDWSKPTLTHRGNAVAPRVQLCPPPKSGRSKAYLLFAIRKPENGHSFVFGSLDLHSGNYDDAEFPFKDLTFNWDYLLDCYEEDGKLTVSALVESYDEEANYIFWSYNTNLKFPSSVSRAD